MRNFSYNNEPQTQSVEDILKYQKKKLFKQQIIFACIFTVLVIIGAAWLYRRVVYTYYDGYIKLDQNHMRAIDDLFVLKVYKNTGDVVQTGDTLYSYVLIDNLLQQHNVNIIPDAVSDLNKMKAQAELARSEVPVLKVRLQELRRRLRNEDNDVYYGVNDNTHQLALEAEIKEVEEQLRELYRKIALYESLAAKAGSHIRRSGYGLNFLPDSPNGNYVTPSLVKYCCASAPGIVTDIHVAEETVAFHKENIIDLQHSDFAASNLCVMAYVQSNKVKHINKNDTVEVIVNDDITLMAQLSLIGLRVEEIPKHLLSNFAHDIDAVIASFTFLPGQLVPFWVLTDNLPVRIRVNNFKADDDESASQIFEIRENNKVVPVLTDTLPSVKKPFKNR